MSLYAATALVFIMFVALSAVAYRLTHRFRVLFCGFFGYAACSAVFAAVVVVAHSFFGDDLFNTSMVAYLGLSAILETGTKILLLTLVAMLLRQAMDNPAVVALGLSYAACEILNRDGYNILASFNDLLAVFGVELLGDAFMAPFRDLTAAVARMGHRTYLGNVALVSLQSIAVVAMHVSTFVILYRVIRTTGPAMVLAVAAAVAVLHAGSDLSTQAAGLWLPFAGPTIAWICLATAWMAAAYRWRYRPPRAARPGARRQTDPETVPTVGNGPAGERLPRRSVVAL